MNWLVHWGERVNWVPLAFLAVAVGLLFLVRSLTVWFLWRRLRQAQAESESEAELESNHEKIVLHYLDSGTHPVPMFVSWIYLIVYVLVAVMTVWGTICTAWWILLLGPLTAILAHVPFRQTMAALTQLERIRAMADDK
jgi:hypothetical protein